MRKRGHDFSGGGFADLAATVVDAALRERKRAAARASLGVEFVERHGFLLGREFGEIDAGKFAGALGIRQENLSGVLESFHFDIAYGEPEERTDFRFVQDGIAQAFVLLNDAAFRVQHKRSRQRGDATVLHANVVGGKSDGIVDAKSFNKSLNSILIVVVHHETENLKAVIVFVLQLDEIWNFRAARSAPGGPKIQENDFAFRVGERDGLAVEASKLEVRRGIGVADKTDRRLLFLRRSEGRKQRKEQRSDEKEN